MRPNPISIFYIYVCAACAVHAAYQDDIGLYDLRSRDASLTGNGIIVGQIEAQFNGDDYQTNPANTGLNSSLFRYYDANSTWASGGNTFDSSRESGHANKVGSRFFGVTNGTQGTDGVAPGVASIEVFEAGHYYYDLVRFGTQTDALVVNQSFIFTDLTESEVDTVEREYDNYAADNGVLFVNGIKNDGAVPPPASAYNGIAVNVAGDSASPLADGRSKPDISAPGDSLTSYVTPLVSGAATILIQSALDGDAGAGTSTAASDIRSVKALLLNGATKPKGWTNTSTRPLDINYGSGVLEINQSHLQLIAGQYAETVDNSTSSNPPGSASNIASLKGWNLGSVTSSFATSGGGPRQTHNYDAVTDHYYFNCDSSIADSFYLTSTLVWNRKSGRSTINNFELYLYQDDGTLIASSVSSVDNVEHLYERHLAPGRYILSIHRPAFSLQDRGDSESETYALAFNFRAAPAPGAPGNLSANVLSSSEIDLTWTDTSDDETGYRIERLSGGSYSQIATVGSNSEFFDDSGLTAGTSYTYRITAVNSTGDSTSVEASGTTYSKIEDWRLFYFGTIDNSGEAADDSDPDFDSIANLIEFTTGSDPTSFSPNPLDTATLGTDGQFSFPWRVDSGYDFSIGFSTDLGTGFTYYDSATLDGGSSPELKFIGNSGPDENGIETRSYGLRDTVTDPSVFLRLQVELVR